MKFLILLLALQAQAVIRAQELVWELHSQSVVLYSCCAPSFGDLNHDGYDDLLVDATIGYGIPGGYYAVRVLSGLDGSVLHEQGPVIPYASLVGVGDFDLDGYPDYAFGYSHTFTLCIEVWSPHLGTMLAQILHPHTSWGWGTIVRGGLDCTGDGLPDLIVSGGNIVESIIYVYDHSGALYYTIPARALGFVVQDIMAVGDIDGDGADDFLVGAVEFHSGLGLGAVALISGRTGVARRIHWGPQPGDILGRELHPAGDVDGDGVIDYAAGNLGSSIGIVRIWSGATGALIRDWREARLELAGIFVAGRDVDLDGRPDIINVAGGYPNVPGNTTLNGRVRTLSSRDGQDMVFTASQQWTAWYGGAYADADLGVQPGNPYPVVAVMDQPVIGGNQWPRIRAWRWSPKGTRFVGQGCSSTAVIPTIGLRRVDPVPPASIDRSRIVLGSAPPDALALCVVAPVSATSGGGVTIPAPLDPLGFTGCTLLVPPLLTAVRVTGSTGMDRGYADVDLMPRLVSTGGVEYAAQWVVLDPITLGYATTARYEFRVQ